MSETSFPLTLKVYYDENGYDFPGMEFDEAYRLNRFSVGAVREGIDPLDYDFHDRFVAVKEGKTYLIDRLTSRSRNMAPWKVNVVGDATILNDFVNVVDQEPKTKVVTEVKLPEWAASGVIALLGNGYDQASAESLVVSAVQNGCPDLSAFLDGMFE